MQITYVSSGLGNNFGDEIELNENLKNYPELHNIILNHELKHTDKAFSLKDLALDLGESKINRLDLFKFMILHPKSFTQLLPIYWSKKHGFVIDLNLILIYIISMFLFIFIIYLGLNL
jgi:hypothetical protein